MSWDELEEFAAREDREKMKRTGDEVPNNVGQRKRGKK
jgi:hypothetical protein